MKSGPGAQQHHARAMEAHPSQYAESTDRPRRWRGQNSHGLQLQARNSAEFGSARSSGAGGGVPAPPRQRLAHPHSAGRPAHPHARHMPRRTPADQRRCAPAYGRICYTRNRIGTPGPRPSGPKQNKTKTATNFSPRARPLQRAMAAASTSRRAVPIQRANPHRSELPDPS